MNGIPNRFVLSTFEAIRNDRGDWPGLLAATAESGIDLVELVFKDRELVTRILPCFSHTGLKAIVQDRVIGGIGDQPADPDEAAVLETLAHYRPYDDVIAGYYLWDEPTREMFSRCRRLNELLSAAAPDKLRLFNVFPSYGVYGWDTAAYQWEDNSYARYVEDFLNEVEPPLLAMDHYPYRPLPSSLVRSDLWRDVGLCSQSARRRGIPFWFYFQGVDLESGLLGRLTPAHVAAQMGGALAYGARALSWFCSMGVLTDVEGERMPEYAAFRRLNFRIKRLGQALFSRTLSAVCHVGLTAEENAAYFAGPLSALSAVRSLPNGLLAAEFTDGEASGALLAVNKETACALSGNAVWAPGRQIRPFDAETGTWGDWELPAPGETLTFAPGETKLWEWRLAQTENALLTP